MSPIVRPLTGLVVNLSISESDDSVECGYPSWQVNRITLQIVAALFGQGAGLAFGHDWREDGVMEAVYGFARQVQPPIPLSAVDVDTEVQPLLRNLLPWPDKPFLGERDLERISSTLRVESAGLPEELEDAASDMVLTNPDDDLYRYVRARGLTFLRHRLDEVCHARICLGGRRSGAQGRYPGVIEEALLAIRDRRPLYLAGLLGGASAQVIAALEGKPMPEDFCVPTSLTSLYYTPPVREVDARTGLDRVVDRDGIWKEFRQAGCRALVEVNGLTADENNALLHTPVIDQVIEMILTGLSRLQRNE